MARDVSYCYRAQRKGGKKKGEARREGWKGRMREPKRAEERKSIPVQSESDKPEQCIVQTHSTTQSHTHVHVEALSPLHTHTCTLS